MNKIYKLVWSKVRNAWVVASEIAKGHGKNASAARERKLLKTAVITAIMGGCLMTGGLASAALTAEQQAVYDAVMAKLEERGGNHYVSVNPLKKEQTADSNYENNGAKGDGGIAIGEDATSQGRGIAMGYKSKAVPKTGATANLNAFEGIAIGQEADMEVPGGIAIGLRSKVEGTLNTKDGEVNVNELGTIALGTDSYAKGNGAAAFGWKAKGNGEGAMAFGTETKAKESGTAFGGHADAAAGGVAVGWQAHAHDLWAMSIGTSSDAKGKYSTALGGSTTAEAVGSTAVGFATVSKGVLSTAVGAQSVAEEPGSVALGADSVANTKAGKIGYIATGSSVTFEDALKTLNKKEDYDKWTAKVNESKAEYDNLTKAFEDAPTKDKKAEAKAALDAWKGQHADFIEALTKKEKLEATWRATKAAVSVGADGVDKAGNRIIESRQITNVAAGTRDTDAVNVAQLKALDTKVEGNKIHYLSIGPDNEKNLAQDGNYNNDGADSHWGIAIGVNASSKGGGSIAIGKGSQAHGTEEHRAQGVSIGSASRAIGAFATAVGHDTKAFGERSVAYGLGDAYGQGSIAIGSGAVAALKEGITKEEYNKLSDEEKAWYGKADYDAQKIFYQFRHKGKDGKVEDIKNYGMAIGSGAKSFDNAGLAVGFNAKTNKDFGVALGGYAENKVEQGVALGTSSVADRAKDVKGYLPTTGKAIENFEEAMKATGKEAAFKELKGKYLAAQEKLAKAQEAYNADQSPTNMMNLDKAQKELKGLTEEYAVMTAPWTSRRGAVSVGNDKTGFTRQITGVAAGSEDTDAVNVAQLKALDNKVTDKLKDAGGVHYFSVNSDDSANPDGTNWKNDGATGGNAVAIGKKAKAGKTNDIAIGTEAAATGGFGFAAGHQAKSSGNADIAIGANAEATGGWGVAIGQDTKAQASTAVAMAFAAEAKGANSLAIGVQSEARTNDSTAYGRGAKALGQVALAVGTLTKAEGNHSSVFGYKATTDSTAWNGTAIGRGAYIGKQAPDGTTPDIGVSDNYYMPVDDDTATEAGKETKNSTAVGFGAKSFGYQNTAVGAGAEAFDTNTVAVGVMSKAIGHYANALGKQARAEGKDSIAIGHFARAIGESSTVLGDYAITSTLDGKKGVSKSVAVGSHARAASDNSIALGNNSLANIADDVKTEAYLSKETFKKENGVVSVGNKEYTVGNEKIEQNYRRITNVAGGADDHDAVNVAQLKVVNEKADKNATDITNLTKTVNANGKATKVTVDGEENKTNGNLKITKETKDGQTTYNLSLNDELTLGKDGKDGKIGINGKDGKSAEITVGKGEPGVDGTNGKDGITRIIYKDEKGNHHEVATLDDGLKFKGDNADVVIRKLNTQLNITGGAKAADLSDDNIGVVGTAGDNGGLAVKLSKKLKGLTSAEFVDGDNITNITAGNVTITRKEGNTNKTVDLWELNNTVNNITNGTTDVSSWKLQANGKNERIIKKDSVVNFTDGANTAVTVNGNDITVDLNKKTKDQIQSNTTKINNIDQRVTTIENNIDQKIEGSKIKVEGDPDTGVTATEVKKGDKVTGYKVSLENKVKVGNVTIDGTTDGTDKKGEITGLTNTTVDAADFATKGRAATEEQLKAAMDNVKTQSRTTVKGKGNITVTPETEGASKYTVELAKDITVDSVTAKTIKADEYKVGDKTYINKDGINANGNKITNVGDGKISKDSTDAVNGKQLYGVEQKVNQNTTNINKLQNNIYDMGMKVGELDTRVNKVGAGAAALAALHPQDFDPEDKWDIAAGVGNYKNATAAAVGLFYRPNERTMLNLGWTMGDSRNMVNAGVSVKLGSGSTYAGLSKVQMATRLTQQEEKITAQEQEIKELREREEQREKQIQEILSKLEMIEKAKA